MRRNDGLALVGLTAIAFAFVLPAIVGGGILGRYPSDGTRLAYFIREYVLATLREGQLPLWNPFTQLGYPFFMNIQWAVFYPLNVLFLPLPVDLAYNLFVGLHLAIAGVGMYLLGRDWDLTPTAAGVASLAYALSERLIGYASGGVVNMLSATVWLPVVVLVFSRALREPRRPRTWALAAMALLALEVLSGHPQETFFAVFTVSLLALGETWSRFRAREARGEVIAPLALWAVVVGGASWLAAVQLVPTWQATRLSTRAFEWSLQWPAAPVFGAYNPLRLLTWVAPDLFGNPIVLRPASTDWLSLLLHEAHSNEFKSYVGVLPLALAGLSLAGWRSDRRLRFLWILAGCSLVLALGHFTPVYGAIYSVVPPLRTFRIPARFLSVTVFAMALLAGFGVEVLRRDSGPAVRRYARALVGLAIVMTAAAAGGVVFRSDILTAAHRLAGPLFTERPSGIALPPAERVALVERAYQLALNDVVWSGIFVALSAVILSVAGRRRRLLGALLVGGTALDLILHAAPYTVSERMDRLMRQHSPLVDIVRKTNANARTLAVPPDRLFVDIIQPNENAFMHHRLLSAGGYDPFESATYRRAIDLVTDDVRRGSGFAAAVYGVAFVVTPLALPDADFQPLGALTNPAATIYATRRALPRVYFVAAARETKDPDEALAAIRDRRLRLGQEALVEATVTASGAPAAAAAGRIEMLPTSPDRVAARVSGSVDGWLIVNDTFFPGIVATVDGRVVPVVRANGLVRAVALPAGTHTVEMVFRPTTLWLGAAISLSGILLAVGVTWLELTRARRRGDQV